jgi:hypothetical protein
MNTSKTSAVLFLLLLGQAAFAEDCTQMSRPLKMQPYDYDKDTVKQAVLILLQSKAITFEPSKGTQINRNLIEEMRRDGLLNMADLKESSICVDPTK